jgi:hypothetical protein
VHSRDLVVLSSVGGRLMMRKMGNQSRVRDFRRVILLFFTHFFYRLSFKGFRSSFSQRIIVVFVLVLAAQSKLCRLCLLCLRNPLASALVFSEGF